MMTNGNADRSYLYTSRIIPFAPRKIATNKIEAPQSHLWGYLYQHLDFHKVKSHRLNGTVSATT
jgi:hypothetical protein